MKRRTLLATGAAAFAIGGAEAAKPVRFVPDADLAFLDPVVTTSYQTRDHGFIACIAGQLAEHYDRDRIARFWNPIASAWFPEGKDDPSLTLLRLVPKDARVWVSQSNPVSFGFALAKAKLTGTEPDVGTAAHLTL